eukprot:Rmarinus@m.17262
MAEISDLAGNVDALITYHRYEPEIIPHLEADIESQCQNNDYHAETNLALLKLYQFHPTLVKTDIVAKILVKSMMKLPSADFQTCLYLISDTVAEQAPIPDILNLSELLETGMFSQFWEAVEKQRSFLNKIPAFDQAIREFMISTIQIAYQKVPKSVVSGVLKMDSGLKAAVEAHGWKESGDHFVLPRTEDNEVKPKKVVEGIQFSHMTKLLATMA